MLEIKSARQERYYLPALLLLGAGILFYGLGRLPLIGPDEPRYAEVAREMFASGDWITPRLGGIHWFEKPALTYWLVASGFTLFGVSEWAARFFIALGAGAGALMLYFFGRRVRSARFGYLSAAALLSSGIWLGFGRGATFDTPLAMTMELSLLAFYLWDREQGEGGKTNFWWYVCCAGLGLAVLAKGLAGLVLPVGVIGLYLLLARRLLKLLKRPGLLVIGAVIFLAMAATWYGPMFARHGREFWNEFFLAHHFQRYLTNKYQHPQPVYFFLAIALMGCVPWTFHLIAAAQQTIKRWRDFAAKEIAEPDRLCLFVWLWALLPVIFFSFSGSKLPGYILPVFPAIALLVGGELERLWTEGATRRFRWMNTLNGLLLVVIAAIVWLRGSAEMGASENEARLAAAVVMAVAIIYLALVWWRREKAATRLLPFGVLAIVLAASHLLFAGLGRQESMRDLSHLAQQQAAPGERLIFYINTEQSLNFYAPELPLRDEKAAMLTLMTTDEIVARLKEDHLPGLLVIGLQRWSGTLGDDERLSVERLGEQPRANRHQDGLDDLVLMRVRLRAGR